MARSKSKKYRDYQSGNPDSASPPKPQKNTSNVVTADSTPELELNQQIDEIIKSIEASMNANACVEPDQPDDAETESDARESHDERPARKSIANEQSSELVADSESNFNDSETTVEKSVDEQCSDLKSANLSDETPECTTEPQIEGISKTFELRIDEFLCQLESKFETWLIQIQDTVQHSKFPHTDHAPSGIANGHTPTANGNGNGAASHPSANVAQPEWEIRKRQMLSEIGLSSEEIEQIVPPSKAPTNPRRDETNGHLKIGDTLQAAAVHIPEPFEMAYSSEEIEQLKEQLNEKLREAEVELAINRARLSKEWAALEQQKAALTRAKPTGGQNKLTPMDVRQRMQKKEFWIGLHGT